MLNLSIETNYLYLLLGLHCLIGITAAIVARKKGLNFQLWLILGLIGGTVALVAALLKRDP
ncbi:MAG TPA: hypothetical protein DEP38_26610 [Cyanobacteria bacterium UBA9226]|nr:hypothetical protein [Cyanobacteria bacterium UBA11153]HCA98044.1 hypothetical protein [Cyanobacteria bacterium UBA9226]